MPLCLAMRLCFSKATSCGRWAKLLKSFTDFFKISELFTKVNMNKFEYRFLDSSIECKGVAKLEIF